MKTYEWDCIWQDEECIRCKYYHVMVTATKQPDCPRRLKPKWRRVG